MVAYKRLAQQVEIQITDETRQPGDKMPSLRHFAQQQSVSMTTAIRCYEYLQDRGYLTARAKSGFYVSLPLKADKTIEFIQFNSEVTSLTQTLSSPYSSLKNARNSPFGTAQLSPELLPAEQLQRCINRVMRKQNNSQFLYGDPQGSQTLRQTLAIHFSKLGFTIQPQQLMITSGCIDAVTLALEAVSKPGDTIAITSPCYNGLLELLSLLNRQVIELPSTPEGLDLDQLQKLANAGMIKACLITANHQNPTGHCLSVEQKQWLAEFAQRMEVPIIEDDVFGELSHQGPMPLPIKAWDQHGWVIWCSSVSKSLAPGLRLGWCHGGRFLSDMVEQQMVRTMGINQPLQEGLAEFINSGHYARHLGHIKNQLLQQTHQYRRYLTEHLPSSTAISNPFGGMVLWIHVPGLDAKQLAQSCESSQIAIRSGCAFSSRGLYPDHFRLNIGWPLDEVIKGQLDKLISLITFQ